MYFFSMHHNVNDIGNHAMYSRGWNVRLYDSLYKLAESCTQQLNSPVIWKYGVRKIQNFNFSDFLVVDVDDASKLSLDQAMEKYARYKHIIGTTKSHRRLKGEIVSDRYRIFLPLERRITSDVDYKALNTVEAAKCGGDLQAASPAQHFMPLSRIVSIQEVGRCVPYELVKVTRRKELPPQSDVPKYVPNYIKHWLEGYVADGERNVTCFKAACGLLKRGFTADETFELIYNSSLPVGRSEAIEREVRSAIRSAAKRV